MTAVNGRRAALRAALDRLYDEFNAPDAAFDPVHIVRRYRDPGDREVVAFCAAALAFGRVASVLQSLERLLAPMGAAPRSFIERFDPARDRAAFAGLGHRWTRASDLVGLLWILHEIIRTSGSLESFFLEGHDTQAPDVATALESLSRRALAIDLAPAYGRVPRRAGVRYFFPRPSAGSACKRLNLFLRWMVRRDRVDPGGWSHVSPAQLVIPLDTHVIRVSQCLRLTRYRSAGWRMAADITASLREIDPADPVRYDFSLCHLGMTGACGFSRDYRDARCPLAGLCRPSSRRRRPSRRPSAPR